MLFQKKMAQKKKVAVVLKDNAYGHGLIEIGKLAEMNLESKKQ